MDNIAISTDEVLAYPEDRYASCPRCIYSADINFATILPLFDLTAKFNGIPRQGKMPSSVRIVKLMRYVSYVIAAQNGYICKYNNFYYYIIKKYRLSFLFKYKSPQYTEL